MTIFPQFSLHYVPFSTTLTVAPTISRIHYSTDRNTNCCSKNGRKKGKPARLHKPQLRPTGGHESFEIIESKETATDLVLLLQDRLSDIRHIIQEKSLGKISLMKPVSIWK